MARRKFDVYRDFNSGSDDGTRIRDDQGRLLCNRCRHTMTFDYDEEKNVDYAICPSCGLIEIEYEWDVIEEMEREKDNDYDTYW